MISFRKLIAGGALGFLLSFSGGGCANLFGIHKAKYHHVEIKDQLSLSNPQKRKLFEKDDLSDVDLSPKKVKVSVRNADIALVGNKDVVFEMIGDFYKEIGIELEFNFVVSPIKNRSSDYTKHISLEFDNAPEFNKKPKWLGYAQVGDGKSYIWLSKCRSYYGYFSHDKANRMIGSAIVHEFGHLFGLNHTHSFANDSLEDYLAKGMPNCMSYEKEVESKTNPVGCWFKELQKRTVHSYLSEGKIYQAYKEVNFNFKRYDSLVGLVNGYYYIPRK